MCYNSSMELKLVISILKDYSCKIAEEFSTEIHESGIYSGVELMKTSKGKRIRAGLTSDKVNEIVYLWYRTRKMGMPLSLVSIRYSDLNNEEVIAAFVTMVKSHEDAILRYVKS